MATIDKVSGVSFTNFSSVDDISSSNIAAIDGVLAPAAGSLLLDTVYGSGAKMAYSVRKLRSAYTGAAMQVQATSGGPTAEIGFDINNNLDTDTLLGFAGTNEVGVTRWYDQSGNGNNALQVSVQKRPIIVSAGGAIVKENERITLTFGNNENFSTTLTTLTQVGFFVVNKSTGSPPSGYFGDYGANNDFVAFLALKYRVRPLVSDMSGYVPTNEYNLTSIHSTTNNGSSVYQSGSQVATGGNASGSLSLDALYEIGGTWDFQGVSQEFILYDADKTADRTSIEENIGDYYTENKAPYLLDTYSGETAAYSLRKLRTAYTGRAIQVQDNIGGATKDISFNLFGELNIVELSIYGGSNDVFVVKWYDQSGNSNDAEQPSSGARPKIYDGGTGLETENGKASIQFAGGNYSLLTSSSVVTGAELFAANVLTMGTTGQPWGDQSSQGVRAYTASGGSSLRVQYNTDNGSWQLTGDNSGNGQRLKITRLISGTQQIYDNGTLATSRTNTFTSLASTDVLNFGRRQNNTTFFNGQIQEYILYNTDENSVRTGIETNLNDFYNIYTVSKTPLLLNSFPGAAAAYSLRKLGSSYSGSAVLVQDNVGGAPKAIAFDSSNNLDSAELIAYGGINDVFVSTWYDQSGNGNNAIQNSASERPKIYDGTTGVVTENGRAAVKFTSNSQILQSTNATAFTGVIQNELYCVASYDTINVGNQYASGVKIGGATRGVMIGTNSSNAQIRYHANATNFETAIGGTIVAATQVLNGGTYDGTTRHARLNGESVGTNTDSGNTGTADVYFIGKHPNLQAGTSKRVQESIIYAAYSSNETGIEANIGAYYNIVLPGLLDKYSGAAVGYSLRRLKNTYVGRAIKVQDNVGGATLDVGFSNIGDLDTAAIIAYGGSNDVFVETWYDQSGNGNNATQATSSDRPKIYDGTTGKVLVENGKPVISSTSTAYLILTNVLFISSARNFIVAHRPSDSPTPKQTALLRGIGSNGGKYIAQGGNGGGAQVGTGLRIDSVANSATQKNTFYTALGTAQRLISSVQDYSSTASTMTIGTSGNDLMLDTQEIIIFNNDMSSSLTGIEENINTFYSIY